MHRSFARAALALALALSPACGGAPKEPVAPEGGDKEAAGEPKADEKPAESSGEAEKTAEGAPEGAAEAKPKGPEKAPSEVETLARDLVKSGGRRIGWSASKKLFVVPNEKHTGDSYSIDLLFYGEDGQSRDPMRVCQPGECEEHLDEILKELLPKLSAKLEEGGYVALRSIGWPSGRDELEVSSLGMKLRFAGGKVEGLKEGKPKVALATPGGRIDASELKAIFVVPDSKLIGVFGVPTKSPGVVQTFYVLKLP